VTFFTAPDSDGIRRIDLNVPKMVNLNLRTIHDTVFSAPTGGEVVEFTLVSGFTIGSTSAASPALRTGSWPPGVSLSLVTLGGRIQGMGGKGGSPVFSGVPIGDPAFSGGDAFQAEFAISIDNTGGEIWAGGGGGVGGEVSFIGNTLVAGGGGGGSGNNGGIGGRGEPATDGALDGAIGTTEAGGAGANPFGIPVSSGGSGGAPGVDGNVNGDGTGTGGAAGRYIVGNGFVTWTANGSRLGGIA
jgi:hypothetical protein